MLMALSEAPSTAYNFGRGKTKASCVAPNIEAMAKKMNCPHGKGGCFVQHALNKEGEGKLTFSQCVGNMYICCALVITGQCQQYNPKKPSTVRAVVHMYSIQIMSVCICAVVVHGYSA